MDEQTRISIYLDESLATLNAAIDGAQHEIRLLREYRTRLIADVVTGKLDVCAAAASLPDEVDEDLAAEAVLADESEDANDAEADTSGEATEVEE